MSTAINGPIPAEILQELVLLRVQLSVLRINAVTEALLVAIGGVIDSREPGQEFSLEVVGRLVATTKAWLGQDERVPRLFVARELFSCARSEDGALFLKFSPEKLPDLLELLRHLQLASGADADAMVGALSEALVQAVSSCLIKNGELTAND